MWLYPLPALLATAGFVFVLVERKNFLKEVRYAVILLIADQTRTQALFGAAIVLLGVPVYFIWRKVESAPAR